MQLSNGFATTGFKIFAGYRFGNKRRWAFEIAYADLSTYEAEVKTTIDINEFATGTIDGTPVEGDVVANGFASFQGSAKLRALSASFIYTIPISKRVSCFPRFGFAHMVGDVQSRKVVSYSYTVNGTTEGIPVGMSDSDVETSVSNSVFRAKIIPLIGGGLNIAATKKYTVRIEYERYGHPTGDPAISVWTISGMRTDSSWNRSFSPSQWSPR